jgi:transcriptional regulator with XRE-family HTH domain
MIRHTSNIYSKRLRIVRKTKKLSQERLGILAGIDESSASARMNQYETGKHLPDFLMAKKIANVLDIPLAYFYTEDDLMAEIILKLHFLSDQQNLEVLNFINSYNLSSSSGN